MNNKTTTKQEQMAKAEKRILNTIDFEIHELNDIGLTLKLLNHLRAELKDKSKKFALLVNR